MGWSLRGWDPLSKPRFPAVQPHPLSHTGGCTPYRWREVRRAIRWALTVRWWTMARKATWWMGQRSHQ